MIAHGHTAAHSEREPAHKHSSERTEYEVIRHARIRAPQASAPRAESPAQLLAWLLVRPRTCSRGRDVTRREGTATLVRARLAMRRAARAQRSTQQARRARRAWHKRAPSGSSSRREPGQEPWRKSRTAPRVRWSGEGVHAATRIRRWGSSCTAYQELIATHARSTTCPSSRRMLLTAIVEGVEEELFHLQRQQNGAP